MYGVVLAVVASLINVWGGPGCGGFTHQCMGWSWLLCINSSMYGVVLAVVDSLINVWGGPGCGGFTHQCMWWSLLWWIH